jgi:hypothetical protein
MKNRFQTIGSTFCGMAIAIPQARSTYADTYSVHPIVATTGNAMNPNPVAAPSSDRAENGQANDLTSMEIIRAVQAAGAFSFWDDPEEDVYTLEAGESS